MPQLMLWGAEQLLMDLQAGAMLEAIDHLAHEIPVHLSTGASTKPGEPDHRTLYSLATLADEMHGWTRELPSSRYYHAWGTWVACMEALRAALGVGWWNPEEDGAAWAARTYAGGAWTGTDIYAKWDRAGDEGEWDTSADAVRHKRCAFWTWWCQTLIPHTWQEL